MNVIWQPRATKQIKKIGDKGTATRLLEASRRLAEFPDCSNVKQLSNHQYSYRLRVGEWRILFDVFEEISIVSVEEVKKRDEHTY